MEVQAQTMAELVEDRLATKQDITLLQRDIKKSWSFIKAMEMASHLGGMVMVAVAAVATLAKLL